MDEKADRRIIISFKEKEQELFDWVKQKGGQSYWIKELIKAKYEKEKAASEGVK